MKVAIHQPQYLPWAPNFAFSKPVPPAGEHLVAGRVLDETSQTRSVPTDNTGSKNFEPKCVD